MQFDDIISRVLCEDTSREERIAALKSISKTTQYRVLLLTMCRGETDIDSDELEEGTDMESVALKAKDDFIDNIREDFDDEDDLQKYINDWVDGPVISDDRTIAGISTGEESMILILSQDSKFFDCADFSNLDWS